MPDRTVLRSALGHNHNALGNLPRLTASRDEAASIRTAFPVGPTLLGAEACETGLGRSDPNGKPVTVGGALRAAQLRLRDFTTVGGTQPYAGPWAWGGFVAYGDAGRR